MNYFKLEYDVKKYENTGVSVFVSEKFKKIIKKNKLTGFDFDKIKVV